MSTALTQQEYVRAGGIRCPFCGSHDIRGGQVDIEPGVAFQEVDCLECDAEWKDRYELTSYSPTED